MRVMRSEHYRGKTTTCGYREFPKASFLAIRHVPALSKATRGEVLKMCCSVRASERTQVTSTSQANINTSDSKSGNSNRSLECISTGLDVQCFIEEETTPQISTSPQVDNDTNDQSMECISTGLDVQCFIENEPLQQSGNVVQESSWIEQVSTALILISPFFFWGTSMVAMKGVIEHTPPLLLGSLRLLPAGAALLAWAIAQGRRSPSTPIAWAWLSAFALVDGAAFQGFLAEGLTRTSAGLGSVIIDSQPLTVAVLASLLYSEPLRPPAIAGLAAGVAGLLMLELPSGTLEQYTGLLLTAGESVADAAAVPAPLALEPAGSFLDNGEFWMLLAAQSMALGTVMVRRVAQYCDPIMATAWHMLLGGAMLAGGAVVKEGEVAVMDSLASLGAGDIAALAYASLLGGAASYGIYFAAATSGSLTALSSLTFLTPVFAAGAGYAVLGEVLNAEQLTGAAITLAAVVLINSKRD